MSPVKEGDRVQIHYTGKFKDGDVFDSSREGDPLEFNAGGPELIPGVSQAVIGMESGESKTVDIAPEQGYGPHLPELVHQVEVDKLPEGIEVGIQLQTEAQGQTIVFTVVDITDGQATLDANHPLAGKDLVFDLEVVSIG